MGMGGVGVASAAMSYHAKARGGARFHSDAQKDAQAVDVGFGPKFPGMAPSLRCTTWL
jgi:hypothetical protein